MGIIFWLSGRPSFVSSSESEAITDQIIGVYARFSGMDALRQVRWSLAIEPYIRKLAHITEYAILFILLYLALRIYFSSYLKTALVTAFICTLYAITDEWHQTYVFGRSGMPVDVFIDLIGVFIAMMICGLVRSCMEEVGQQGPLEDESGQQRPLEDEFGQQRTEDEESGRKGPWDS